MQTKIERFIGREKEIEAFQSLLPLDRERTRFFFLQGPGGIGKTWLLRRCLEIAAELEDTIVATDLIDMYSTTNRYINGVIRSIIQQIPPRELQREEFYKFQKALQIYEDARLGKFDQLSDDQSSSAGDDQLSRTEKEEYLLLFMRDAFQQVIRSICKERTLVLAFDTFEIVQNGPVGKWLLSKDGIDIPGVLCLIASRQKPLEDSPGYKEFPYLVVSQLSDEEALLLYYKYTGSQEPTTERLREYIHVLNIRAEGNPLIFGLATLWLTVSTENDIEKIRNLRQENFEEAVVSWLNPVHGRGSYHLGGPDLDEPMRQVLVLMAYLNRRFDKFFLKKLVDERFVKVGRISVDDLWNQLSSFQPEFFYVKGRPEGEIQLHDKLAEMLRRYIFVDAFGDLTGSVQTQFTQRVVDWYDELIVSQESEDIEEEAHTQVLRAEKLAYVLRLDVLSDWLAQKSSRRAENTYRILPAQFQQTVSLLNEYKLLPLTLLGRLLVNDMRMHIIQAFPNDLRYDCASIMGEIAQGAYQYEDAISYWIEAEQVASSKKDVVNHIRALLGQNAGLIPTNLQETVNVLQTALKLVLEAPEFEVELLYEMGFVHRRLDDIERAVKYYEQALEKAMITRNRDWLPTILNDLGYAKLFLGEPEPELNDDALELRSINLYIAENKVNEITEAIRKTNQNTEKIRMEIELAEAKKMVRKRKWEVGLTYNTLGQIYRYSDNLPRATAEYSQALTIFQEIGDKKWEAEALYSRSEAHRRLAAEFFELGRTRPCMEYDERTFRDIDSSVDICERYNFVDKIPTAYRRKGRLFHDRFFRAELTGHPGHYWLDEALILFDKGYKFGKQYNQILEEFENLTEKAFLGDDRIAYAKKHNPRQVRTEIRKAEENLNLLNQLIDEHRSSEIRIYQYPVFIHLAELEEGALKYVQGEFDLALEKFLAGFSGLAKTPGYGQFRFKQHINILWKFLRTLDESSQKKWCEAFSKAWSKPGEDGRALSDIQPDFLRKLDRLQKTSFMYRRLT
jgi:tetratricopeptide (TPR) repeat protein